MWPFSTCLVHEIRSKALVFQTTCQNNRKLQKYAENTINYTSALYLLTAITTRQFSYEAFNFWERWPYCIIVIIITISITAIQTSAENLEEFSMIRHKYPEIKLDIVYKCA